jgi:tetratricopeptide (TPR) repeat protein
MNRYLSCGLAVVVALSAAYPTFAQRDLRAQFGTESVEVAKTIQRGIEASSAGRSADAQAAFKDAIRLDPKCGMAYFQLALVQGDVGEIEEAIASNQKILGGETTAGRNIHATAATNLGLTFGRLNKLDESNLAFTRGILEDYENQFKERGKAYRNLSLNLRAAKAATGRRDRRVAGL